MRNCLKPKTCHKILRVKINQGLLRKFQLNPSTVLTKRKLICVGESSAEDSKEDVIEILEDSEDGNSENYG